MCCVALPCCLFDLACFFLPSFSHFSLKHVYVYTHAYITTMYMYIHVYTCGVSNPSTVDEVRHWLKHILCIGWILFSYILPLSIQLFTAKRVLVHRFFLYNVRSTYTHVHVHVYMYPSVYMYHLLNVPTHSLPSLSLHCHPTRQVALTTVPRWWLPWRYWTDRYNVETSYSYSGTVFHPDFFSHSFQCCSKSIFSIFLQSVIVDSVVH